MKRRRRRKSESGLYWSGIRGGQADSSRLLQVLGRGVI